jgi:hypothetical protein
VPGDADDGGDEGLGHRPGLMTRLGAEAVGVELSGDDAVVHENHLIGLTGYGTFRWLLRTTSWKYDDQ